MGGKRAKKKSDQSGFREKNDPLLASKNICLIFRTNVNRLRKHQHQGKKGILS